MQLVVFALLGCCVVAHSASLSDNLAVERDLVKSEERSTVESDDLSDIELSPEDRIRDKRSGSGGFLAGIGSAILGKVAQASSGISSGSSDSRGYGHQYESVEYGAPVHGYDETNFDIWSFKKAILNTLFQALKAIGGGVIALKGKLIKGGGVIVSAKGNIISAKGEAISTLGRQIAASAVLTPPKATNGYIYEAPVHVPSAGAHDSYVGHPSVGYNTHGGYAASASSDSYGHSAYASPSDDADHPGLLIVKPVRQETSEHHTYHSFQGDSVPHGQHPDLAVLGQSFGGSKKSSGLENIIGKLASASNSNGGKSYGKDDVSVVHVDVGHSVEHVEHKEHQPESSYGLHLGYDNAGESAGGHGHQETHVVHTAGNSELQIHSDDEKLGSSLGSTPSENHYHQQQYQKFEDQNLGYRTVGPADGHSSHNDYVPFGNGGPLLFSMPLEIPILQSHDQSNYYSTHNQLGDYNVGHNSYNHGGSVIKRNSVKERIEVPASVRISPSIGYMLKNSMIYRI